MNYESDEEFWSNRFHHCALAAGLLAASEGRLADSRYVQRLAYDLYERGAFRGEIASKSLTNRPGRATADASLTNAESKDAPEEEAC